MKWVDENDVGNDKSLTRFHVKSLNPGPFDVIFQNVNDEVIPETETSNFDIRFTNESFDATL